MPPVPQSQRWSSDRAVLFVHGIGNARPGDYNPLVAQVEQLLGDQASNFAFYFLYYDQINDWFATKTQAGLPFEKLVGAIRSNATATNATLCNAIADFTGDVIWPILVADARTAVREAYLSQLRQIVRDGEDANVPVDTQRITIIAHSLGCFHTYEALHEAAADEAQGLSPARWGVRFQNVIFMASPVQLIRTVAAAIGAAVPQRDSLHCVRGARLEMPFELTGTGKRVDSAEQTVSITGDLDPVGGHFLRARQLWAYMNLPGQKPFIDKQQLVATNQPEDLTLAELVRSALRDNGPPTIVPQNPHDWGAYITRHSGELRTWLTA